MTPTRIERFLRTTAPWEPDPAGQADATHRGIPKTVVLWAGVHGGGADWVFGRRSPDARRHAWTTTIEDVMEKAAPVTIAVWRWDLVSHADYLARDPYVSFFGDQRASEIMASEIVASEIMITDTPSQSESVVERFEHLAERWEDQTWAYSFPERKVLHEAYQKIMTMGRDVVPLILRRLQERGPDHWFWALEMITDENPADHAETMSDATTAWLAWGRERGIV